MWITVWLVVVIGGIVAVGALAGPWVTGGAVLIVLASWRSAVVQSRRRATESPADPALDPPPDEGSG